MTEEAKEREGKKRQRWQKSEKEENEEKEKLYYIKRFKHQILSNSII